MTKEEPLTYTVVTSEKVASQVLPAQTQDTEGQTLKLAPSECE